MAKSLSLAIMATIIVACNNSERSVDNNISTTTATTNDTIAVKPSLIKRSAVLGYSYFKSMRQNETRNINAYVSIINSSARVIDTLREINSEDLPERESDTASIFSQNVYLYKFLDIALIDPDSDFIIKQIHDSARQKIDDQNGNLWSWAVTPKTRKSHARIILRVIAETPEGRFESLPPRNITIDISLDRGIFRAIYTWLLENPEKALVLILIPLIVFFWKQIVALFGRKSTRG